MFDFEAFEEVAGHSLTLVQAMHAGVSTYYCESCGAIVMVGGPDVGLLVFHVSPGSTSTEERCPPVDVDCTVVDCTTLKDKLDTLEQASYERLRRI